MNPSRISTSLLLRATRSTIPRSARQWRVLPAASNIPKTLSTKPNTSRSYSQAPPKPSKLYTFEEIQSHAQSPSSHPSRILVDTREPEELRTTGTIPGSLNIPITSKPDSFFITEEEFEDRFGFERPGKDTEVVFFCKAGVRSRAAAELARQAGWKNVSEYPGSWLDWSERGGKKEGGRG